MSQGSINEFAVSMGANFNNIVYVGATIGIRSVYKKVGMTYQEEYGYFDAAGNSANAVDKNGTPLNAQLDYMSLYQESKIDGSGVDFKLGVIVRPVAGLRVGVAFHTPTYYWLDRSYRADIESHLKTTSIISILRRGRTISAATAGISCRLRGCCSALRTRSATSPSCRSTMNASGTTASV